MGGDELRLILANNIKLFRGRRNWSQATLAEKTDLSIVYLSDIERGNKWPYLDTLVKLADAFEIDAYELLKPKEALSADMTAILVKYTEESVMILDTSLEFMKKSAIQSLINLRDQYASEIGS